MALGSVLPWYGGQFFDDNGNPIASGKVFFYLTGTSTKTDTYSDANLTTANANPVVLDAAGRANIFLSNLVYKVVIAKSTAADPPVGADIIKTLDGVSASTALAAVTVPIVAGQSITAGQWIYMDTGSIGTAGRWYLTDADTAATSSAALAIGVSNDTLSAGESGTAVVGGRYTLLSGTVTTGSQYYLSGTAGAIVASSAGLTNVRAVAFADSTTTLLITPWQLSTDASATLPGIVNLADQVLGDGIKTFQDPPKFYAGSQSLSTSVVSGVLNVNSDTKNSALTVSLYDYTIPGGTLSANGKAFRLTIWGSTAANANAKQVTVTAEGDTLVTSGSVVYNNIAWKIEVIVIRTSTTAGISMGRFDPNRGVAAYGTEGPTQTNLTVSHTWANDFRISCDGTYVSNADWVKNGAVLEVLNC